MVELPASRAAVAVLRFALFACRVVGISLRRCASDDLFALQGVVASSATPRYVAVWTQVRITTIGW